jgi:predicted transposase YdaD
LNLVTPIQETKAYQSIFAEGWDEGKAKGKAEGKVEGKAEGKADTLKHLLRRRFDTIPAWAEQRIDAASIAQLDTWLDGIFEAQSLDALIGSAPN